MYQSRHMLFNQKDGTQQARLPEIVDAFFLALDLSEGQSAGPSIRSCWIGIQIAMARGMKGDNLRDVCCAVLLKELDDYWTGVAGVGAPVHRREQPQVPNAEHGGGNRPGSMAHRRVFGSDLARQPDSSEDVAIALAHVGEHWDGGGRPLGLGGRDIHIAARIALLAQTVDDVYSAHGSEAALAEVRNRTGSWLDPELCVLFEKLSEASGFWEELALDDLPEQFLGLLAMMAERQPA